jgi:hypothetical protein
VYFGDFIGFGGYFGIFNSFWDLLASFVVSGIFWSL